MTELIQSLKAAVARYPGTMAELARRAAIDRSTLYKILGGQRTPRREQLERLTDALELTEEEKTTLLVQYKQRGRGTEPARRYSNPEDHRAAGLCRPQNCRIKQKSPGGCRGSLSLSCICWLL